MAHLEAYTRKQIGKISNETYRKHEREEAYKNNVDLSKSHLNYSMRGLDRNEFLSRIDERCLEVMQGRKMQDQTKVVGSWVFTCPEELRGNPDAEKKYFKTAMEFCEARYGSENVIDGVVHYDETSPHMTVYTVPVGKSRKTGLETVSKASVFTRTDLQQFHTDFEQVLKVTFGKAGLGLNGRTKGNYTLEELKQRTKDEKARADLMKQIKDYNEAVRKFNIQRQKQREREEDLDTRESEILRLETELEQKRENLQQDIENRLEAKLERLKATEDRLSEVEKLIEELNEEKEDLKKEIATLTQTKQDIMTSKQKKDFEDKRKEFERRMEELGSSGIEIER